ncbi:MAG: response regulator [Blastocatellia bacterium]
MTVPLRVLHVEDDPLDSELIQNHLRADGIECELVRVETRAEMQAALETGNFEIILSDYALPTFNGFEALAWRNEKCPHLPFILISGTLGEEATIEAFQRGATDYVLKQRMERLGPSVRRALREAAEHNELRRAEAELRMAHQRMRFHIENSPLAIIEFDKDMRVQYWSPQAEKIFGWTTAEAMGRLPGELKLVHPDDEQQVQEVMRQLLEGRVSRNSGENRNCTKDGQVIWCEWYNSALMDEHGHLISILSLGLDITGRRRMEAERARLLAGEQQARETAEAASRAKDEFLAAVSHELRTPMTPVLGWLRLIRGGTLNAQATAHALEKIEHNVRAEIRLVEDLLDVSRIITGKLRIDCRPLELLPIIESAIDSMSPAAEARGITLRLEADSLSGLVAGDPDRLRQVVWNVLSNAIKFTPQGGRVAVRLERTDSQMIITVSDTGQGIHADFLPFMFERFRQADASLTRAHGGLGLGLAIVRHLVELHGGTVTAYSAGPGKGTTLTIALPLLDQRHKVSQPERRQSVPQPLTPKTEFSLDGVRALAVDDDPDTLEILTWVLTQSGAQVRTAPSALAALDIFQQDSVDVVISDIGMPGLDGYDLIRRIRELEQNRRPQVPAIALTAFTRIEDRLQALASGFQMYISKPVEPEELVAVIASLTGRLDR